MNEWISVKDRLPDPNTRSLAWMDGYQFHSDLKWARYGFAFMVRWESGTDHATHDGWSYESLKNARTNLGADDLDVTHWMPLPEPPK